LLWGYWKSVEGIVRKINKAGRGTQWSNNLTAWIEEDKAKST
jgi:hypothetical protein